MGKQLSKQDKAYNACIDAKNEAKARLDSALEDYNRAAVAAEWLCPLKLHPQLRLAELE